MCDQICRRGRCAFSWLQVFAGCYICAKCCLSGLRGAEWAHVAASCLECFRAAVVRAVYAHLFPSLMPFFVLLRAREVLILPSMRDGVGSEVLGSWLYFRYVVNWIFDVLQFCGRCIGHGLLHPLSCLLFTLGSFAEGCLLRLAIRSRAIVLLLSRTFGWFVMGKLSWSVHGLHGLLHCLRSAGANLSYRWVSQHVPSCISREMCCAQPTCAHNLAGTTSEVFLSSAWVCLLPFRAGLD